MSEATPKSQNNKPTLSKYLLGDLVLLVMWTILIGFTYTLSKLTSFYLLPLWFYVGLCLLALILPKPKPGQFAIDSKETVFWFVSFQFNRIWHNPFIKHIIFSFAVLRTIFLRCCGAKVSMNIGWSSTSNLSDPSMLEIGPNTIIGIETLITGHTIINGRLLLGKIKFEDGCLIGARSAVGPNTIVGKNAVLEVGVELLPGARIPNGAYIGKKSMINHSMLLEENKKYPGFMKPGDIPSGRI
jgi:acetyltransferase-like isoleucine patch superfamily enzyme